MWTAAGRGNGGEGRETELHSGYDRNGDRNRDRRFDEGVRNQGNVNKEVARAALKKQKKGEQPV